MIDSWFQQKPLTSANCARWIHAAALRSALTRPPATAYPFGPFSVADLFEQMPKYWGLFVTHFGCLNLSTPLAETPFTTATGIKFDCGLTWVSADHDR